MTGTDVGAAVPMTFLTDLSERDKPWDEHRTNASLVSALYSQAGLDQRASRMDIVPISFFSDCRHRTPVNYDSGLSLLIFAVKGYARSVSGGVC